MAAGGLLAFFDDITVILDDVAAMSKIAARKTVGIVGDDLAVNANVVVGIDPKRELPIVGKIALGSLVNKAVLIPLALAVPSSAILPVLMFGGAFLCYEAFHKISHKEDAQDQAHKEELLAAIQTSPEALMKVENKKVMGAIGTDTVLSAEVIAVALGAVAAAPLMTKAVTLSVIGIGMTIGVYGLVAVIVKVDDLGLHLQQTPGESGGSRFKRNFGKALVDHMPKFMKTLSFLGTAAMFTVGGGIVLHGIPGAEDLLKHGLEAVSSNKIILTILDLFATLIFGLLLGLVTSPFFGLLLKGFSKLKKAVFPKKNASEEPPAPTH